MLALEKMHETNTNIVADDAVDTDLGDEISRVMCSIRKKFGKITKTHCEEAFNTSTIGRALTIDSSLQTVGTGSELKTHVKNLVDRKEKLNEERLDFFKVQTHA